MTRVAPQHEENVMSRGTVDRIRFFAGVGIAASGAAVLTSHLVGLFAA